ncbi:MAG: CDP-alcohol phosphatidyltransferase family protein [Candidatus Omnitrophica bacterium]|nr:CDP-alcohol phosphatidyltransferase family protein [Candidatus Omnitrophota bacterium]
MNLANKFSMTRLLLSPVFVLSVIFYRSDDAVFANLPLGIFIAAIITDVCDGYIARRLNQITALGKVLDPLADKLLLTVAFVSLSLSQSIGADMRIPVWVMIIIITRDIFILIGAGIIYLLLEYIEFKPTNLGKTTTFVQMMTVLSVLLKVPYSYVIWDTAVFFTLLSGLQYLIRASDIISERYK